MSEYRRGVEDAIRVLMERGSRIRGAVQPSFTATEIRQRLLSKQTYFDGYQLRERKTWPTT